MTLTGAPVEIGGALPASRPVVARAASTTEATLRRTGALVVLAAASVLVHLLLFPAAEELLKLGALAAYAIVLLGCAGVLFSPAHRARRAADAAVQIFRAAAGLLSAPALVSLAAASALLLLVTPVPAAVVASNINGGVLAIYAVFLLDCAAVLLSPAAHPAVADLARRAAETARNMSRATFFRWTGFACICVVLYAIRAVGDVRAEAAAATSSEQYALLFMFVLFLVGVWTVSLSTVTGRAPPMLPVRLPLPPPPPVEDAHGCGVVNGTAAPADARDSDLFSKV